MKINRAGELAPGKATYVDDIRVGARGFEAAKRACAQISRGIGSFGNQADPSKLRPPSTRSGGWIGFLCHTDRPFPMKSLSGKKLTRFRDGLNKSNFVGTGELRRIAGLGRGACDGDIRRGSLFPQRFLQRP